MASPASVSWQDLESGPDDARSALMDSEFGQGCVGAWVFHPGWQRGLTVFDLSPFRNNGTLTNFTLPGAWTPRGLTFAGDDDFIDVTGLTTQTTDHTVVAFGRFTNAAVNDYLFDSASGRVIIGAPGLAVTLQYYDGAGWFDSGTTYLDGNLHMVAANALNGSVTLLVDDTSTNAARAARNIGGAVSIGSRFSQDTDFMAADLAFMGVWDRALGAGLILQLLADPLAPFRWKRRAYSFAKSPAAAGGPFPHHIRRLMKGGMIAMEAA